MTRPIQPRDEADSSARAGGGVSVWSIVGAEPRSTGGASGPWSVGGAAPGLVASEAAFIGDGMIAARAGPDHGPAPLRSRA